MKSGEVILAADRLGSARHGEVLARRRPDAPAGLDGTKSLQDLFTDRKVPRALRRSLPVLEANGEIVWVAGVAAIERAPGDPVALDARQTTG